jgi:potassium uptake TrkH family protein
MTTFLSKIWSTIKTFFADTHWDDVREQIFHSSQTAMTLAAILAVISLLLEYGFRLSPQLINWVRGINSLVILLFIFTYFIRLLLARDKKTYFKKNLPGFVLIILLFLQLILFTIFQDYTTFINLLKSLNIENATRGYIVLMQIFFVISLLLTTMKLDKSLQKLRLYPAQTLVLSFLFLIIIGTLLLLLPKASTKPGSIHPVDALFTSTSAVCVTGLIVLDTAKDYTILGQMIIMFLIQFGGLGIMTSTAFFAIITGRGVGIRERAFMKDVLSTNMLGEIGRILVYIFSITFLLELLGWAVLFQSWLPHFDYDMKASLYHSMFHSVSAFCNAGFSTFSNNVESFHSSIWTNLMISTLIIFGGLGFTVIINLLNYRLQIFKKRRRTFLSLQTKMVLIMTGVLIVGGAILLLILEYDNAFAHLSFFDKAMAAYFQSVSTRTAGFNTVPFGDMRAASYFLMMILMFIGASPGSTGGGIKTTTFMVLFLTMISTMKNTEKIEFAKKTVSLKVIRDAIAVAFLALVAVCMFAFTLLLTENLDVIDIFFEVFSAFGTVGLSAGITSQLSYPGRVIITILMFIGRVGPLTLVLAMGQQLRKGRYSYPEENVMIG